MSTKPKASPGCGAALVRVFLLPWVFGVGGLALMLAIVAESASGGLCGLAFFCTAVGTSILLLVWGLDWQRVRRTGVALLIAGLVFLVWSATLAPSGKTAPDAAIQSTFGERDFCRLSLANIVPEIDQFTLGSYLVPVADPFIDLEQSARLRGLFQEVYRELRKDDDFREVGSVMNYAYRHPFGLPYDAGHQYSYIPGWRDEPYPVIIFMHGSGGNFKAYMWVLKALADEHEIAIIAPSMGFGLWPPDKTEAAIQQALESCDSDPRLDASRVWLAGLSNGGYALGRSGTQAPRLQGFIGISPVLHPQLFGDADLHAAWNGKPVLLLHGEEDRRIPLHTVERAAREMKWGGQVVSTQVFPKEDHFLFFSQREAVLDAIHAWLSEQAAYRPLP